MIQPQATISRSSVNSDNRQTMATQAETDLAQSVWPFVWGLLATVASVVFLADLNLF